MSRENNQAIESKNHGLADLMHGLSTVNMGGKLLSDGCQIFKSVAIVGSSCSGKTTLLNSIRSSSLCREKKVLIPVRYTTRPKRENDIFDENIYITEEEFTKKAKNLQISLYWKKKMDDEREARFGFAPPAADRLSVYSGNNGLLYNQKSVYPRGILDMILFVGIYAPDEVRKERLFMRSPDLVQDKPKELFYRLEDKAEKIFSRVHLVINNYGPYMKDALSDIVELIRRMAIKYSLGHG